MLDPHPFDTPPPKVVVKPKMGTIKPGCTTRYAGLSYHRFLHNSVQPRPRNAMDKFRGEKEKGETVQKQCL